MRSRSIYPAAICQLTVSAAFLLLLQLTFICRGEEPLIPFDHFYVSVETNALAERSRGEDWLSVSVSYSAKPEAPSGEVSIEVNCFQFPPASTEIGADDQKAFFEAVSAAQMGKPYSKIIISKTTEGKVLTTYKSFAKPGGGWAIRTIRSGASAEFSVTEGQRLEDAIKEAIAGKAWFESLKNAAEAPVPTASCHPPKAPGCFIISRVGEILAGGIGCEVSVGVDSRRSGPDYYIRHGFSFYFDGEMVAATSSGSVEGILSKISELLNTMEVSKRGAFNARQIFEREGRYVIKANAEAQKIAVTFYPGESFSDRTARSGQFGVDELTAIGNLVAAAESRKKWLEGNESLFFKAP